MPTIKPEYDAYNQEEGLEQCVLCGETFGEGNWAYELVLTKTTVVNIHTGTEYDALIETQAGEDLAHPECYEEKVSDQHADEHKQLTEF